MRAIKIILSTILLPLSLSVVIMADGYGSLTFKGESVPIKVHLSANNEIGAIVFESDYSDSPDNAYDTILIQGEMPEPNLKIEIWVKQKFLFFNQNDKYDPIKLKRFPNGRFWAKFRIKEPSQNPIKLAFINMGIKTAHTVIIYNIEIFQEKTLKTEIYPEEEPTEIVEGEIEDFPPDIPFNLIRRKDWKAQNPTEPYVKHIPKRFTIHHTAARYPKNIEESSKEMVFIQDYHQNAREWIDIGYHLLIDPLGNIFEGRPVDAIGAHVKDENIGNIGISLMGNYHPPISDTPTIKTFENFIAIGKYLKETYSINISSFYAHRDLDATACPGDLIYEKIPKLKKAIFEIAPVPDINPEIPPETIDKYLNSKSFRQLINYSKP
ncbi:MAG: peptidoglycan recognition protein family protein [Elusimicrobia bacterium]|nr:peptidoglycan recognition protein family protein [Elusimicrobiota bacterium]